MKHDFSLLKNIKPLPDKRIFSNIPLQSVDYSKRDSFTLYVNNKIQEIIVVVYCLTLRNEKCVYISTNKTSGFEDCDKCKASCHLLNIPSKEKKPNMPHLMEMVLIFHIKRQIAPTDCHLIC